MKIAASAALLLTGLAGLAATAQTPATHAGAAQTPGPPAPSGTADGAALFAANCSACHQEKGEGIPGAFPALAGDAFVVGDPMPPVMTLLNGRGGMPSFRDDLKDDQLAAVLSYVRASWGNHAPPVDATTFAAARAGAAAVVARPIPAH